MSQAIGLGHSVEQASDQVLINWVLENEASMGDFDHKVRLVTNSSPKLVRFGTSAEGVETKKAKQAKGFSQLRAQLAGPTGLLQRQHRRKVQAN